MTSDEKKSADGRADKRAEIKIERDGKERNERGAKGSARSAITIRVSRWSQKEPAAAVSKYLSLTLSDGCTLSSQFGEGF